MNAALLRQEVQQSVHIAHLVYSFRVGGLENGIVNLINTLPQDNLKHSIICLTDYDPAFFSRIKAKNVSIYRLNKGAGQDLAMFWRLFTLLRQLKPTVVHSRNLATLEGQLLAALLRIPLRIHGEHGWDMADLAGANRRYLWLRRLVKPWIHRFIALSCEGLHYLHSEVVIPRRKLHHICNGVDTDNFCPQQSGLTVPAEMANDNALWIGTVGRLATVKNQRLLIEAFQQLLALVPEHAPRLRLMLVGDGSERAGLEDFCQQQGLASRVWFCGERSDIVAAMNRLDIFALPSLAEGISNTLLEAMACGLPIVATDVGGNGDLIAHQESGFLVPSQDPGAMAQALADYVQQPALLQQHGLAARQRALTNFSLTGMVDEYAAIYGIPAGRERPA